MNRTMIKCMWLCPEYRKYIERKAKDHGDYHSLLTAYNDIEKETSDE